jgi:hypothetical protein
MCLLKGKDTRTQEMPLPFTTEEHLPYFLMHTGLHQYAWILFFLIPVLKKVYANFGRLLQLVSPRKPSAYVMQSIVTYTNGQMLGIQSSENFKATMKDLSRKIAECKFPHTLQECMLTTNVFLQFSGQFQISKNVTATLEKKCETIDKQKSTHHAETYTLSLYPKGNDTSVIHDYLDDVKTEYDRYIELSQLRQPMLFVLEPFRDEFKIPHYSFMPFKSNKSFDNLFFEQKQILIDKLDYFKNHKEEYDRLGIPYALGMLFHGEPGTGKTSAIKAIARYTGRHIIVLSTRHIRNYNQLKECLVMKRVVDYAIPHEKRLYVIEEIDCSHWEDIVNSRKPKDTTAVSKDPDKDKDTDFTITLGDLLELLDGIIELPGRMIIFTTNHPERIDPALMRPGRVDINVCFKRLNRFDVARLYHLWFHEVLNTDLIRDYEYTQAELGQLFSEHGPDVKNVLIDPQTRL